MSADDIVVGLDFDISSRTALQWAAQAARNSGQPLVAVHVLDDVSRRRDEGHGQVTLLADDQVEHGYRHAILNEFDSVRPDPSWRLRFARGPAAKALVQAADHASMLVVGTQEHVGLARLIDGSVSHYCVSHASCPVVVVPTTPA